MILQLLAEKPRHGYEIIKALEDKFGGAYAPSAGTVYPTLSLLEDLGYATVRPEEGGKKIYDITDEGRRYLEQNQSVVDDIFERIADMGASLLTDGVMAVNRGMGLVAKATYAPASHYYRDNDKLKRVSEVLERAAREIDDIVAGRSV